MNLDIRQDPANPWHKSMLKNRHKMIIFIIHMYKRLWHGKVHS